jgi:uncharacterized protein YdaU (DUF1376 family)
MSRIGHNKPPVEKKVPDLDSLLDEEPEKLFIYASWHIGDYITGTMGMTLEMEGAYQRFLMRLYQRGKPLPDDDKFMSMVMSLTTRVWKRVKAALIDAGKILLRAGCLTNSRFEKERIKRAEQRRKQIEAGIKRWEKDRAEKESLPKVSPKFAPSLPEVSPKLSPTEAEKINNYNKPPVTHLMESRIQESKNPSAVVAALDGLLEALQDAAGPAIANPAACPGLLMTAPISGWIEQGYDLQKDILPAIRARSARAAPGTIRSWSYFTQAVADAKASRTAPMPKGREVASRPHSDREKATQTSWLKRELEAHKSKIATGDK